MKKHYKALGLEEGASKAEIEKKYKELSKEYDPKNCYR
jgi:curved DNA-binding protein CbpA